ncbi:MAG: lipid II:glycine glycyltransferase FemX [Acidobacteriota bacterium]
MRWIVIDPEKDSRWDGFILESPTGSVYHLSSWIRVVASAYGYTSFCLALESAGKLRGIAPFLRVNSPLTGKRLVSLPFTSYCRALFPPLETSRVVDLALKCHPDVDYVEFRFPQESQPVFEPPEPQLSFTTHVLNLDRSLDALVRTFHTSVRRSIRKADRSDLRLRMAETEADLKEFYKLEVAVRKKHGLPPQPYRFFARMWKILRPKKLLFMPLVEHGNRVVAASLMLRFKDTFHYEYAASDRDFLRLRPNHKLIWETIQMAHREGARYYDFGRTSLTNPTLALFKERWGAQPQPLAYHRFPRRRRVPGASVPLRPLLTFVHRRLPAPLLRLEGRLIYPHMG